MIKNAQFDANIAVCAPRFGIKLNHFRIFTVESSYDSIINTATHTTFYMVITAKLFIIESFCGIILKKRIKIVGIMWKKMKLLVFHDIALKNQPIF